MIQIYPETNELMSFYELNVLSGGCIQSRLDSSYHKRHRYEFQSYGKSVVPNLWKRVDEPLDMSPVDFCNSGVDHALFALEH